MKKQINHLILLVSITCVVFFTSCENSNENLTQELSIEQKIQELEKGKWLLKDFEDRIMYAFLNGERATYYGTNGVFANDPIPTKNPYTISNSLLQIDLHFGTIKMYKVEFSCNNTIAKFYENDVLTFTLYKKDSSYKECL